MTVTEDAHAPREPGWELPTIVSVDDHVVEPPHVWETWLPERFRDRGPKVERRGIGHMKHIGGGAVRADLRPRRPAGRLLGLRGPRLHPQAPRRRRRLRPRRHDDVADHLRRDAPRLLRPQGPRRGHADEPRRGVAVLPDVPPVLRPDLHRGQGPRARRGLRLRLQRLDGRGVVRRLRRPAPPAADHPAVGRRAGRRRGRAATPSAACTPCASARSRRTSGCRRSTPATWDPFIAACQETETVICMHIGSSSRMPATSADAPVAVAATLSFNNAMASMSDWLFSGKLVQFPDLKLAYSEGQIGWIPYILERADTVWEEHRAWGGVKDLVPEPPSHLLLPPDLRLLLPRPARHRRARQGRRGQHHLRDRLPPHRLDLARHQGGRHRADGGRAPDVGREDHARQRPPHARRSMRSGRRLRLRVLERLAALRRVAASHGARAVQVEGRDRADVLVEAEPAVEARGRRWGSRRRRRGWLARSRSSAAAMRRSDSVISQRATPLPRHAAPGADRVDPRLDRHGAPSPAGRRRTARGTTTCAAGRIDGEHREVGAEAAVARVPLRPLLGACAARSPSGRRRTRRGRGGPPRRAPRSTAPARGRPGAGIRRPARGVGRATSRKCAHGLEARLGRRSASRSTWCSAASISQLRRERRRRACGAISAPRCTAHSNSCVPMPCRRWLGRTPPQHARPCGPRARPGIAFSHAKPTSSVAVPHEPGVGRPGATTPTPTRRRGRRARRSRRGSSTASMAASSSAHSGSSSRRGGAHRSSAMASILALRSAARWTDLRTPDGIRAAPTRRSGAPRRPAGGARCTASPRSRWPTGSNHAVTTAHVPRWRLPHVRRTTPAATADPTRPASKAFCTGIDRSEVPADGGLEYTFDPLTYRDPGRPPRAPAATTCWKPVDRGRQRHGRAAARSTCSARPTSSSPPTTPPSSTRTSPTACRRCSSRPCMLPPHALRRGACGMTLLGNHERDQRRRGPSRSGSSPRSSPWPAILADGRTASPAIASPARRRRCRPACARCRRPATSSARGQMLDVAANTFLNLAMSKDALAEGQQVFASGQRIDPTIR